MINSALPTASHPSLKSSSPGRPIKRRIFPHTPPPPKTRTNATDRYTTTPDLESTPDSESAKGHPELLVNNRQLLAAPSTAAIRQKYSMIRPKHMIPILLFLAAGVPFIVHLKLGTEMQQQSQQKIKLDEPILPERKSSTKRKKPHSLQLDVHEEPEFLPKKRDSHFLRHHPSNKQSLMKFHSILDREIPTSPWNLLMPSSTETIKVDGITVSMSGMGNDMEVRGNNFQESPDDVKEVNPKDENDPNADNTASHDETRVLTSETAAWEPDQECVPMEDWQTTFKPTCNSLHEMDMPFLLNKEAYSLVSNKGFWRNAWNVDMQIAENGMSPVSNIVIKSLKYYHEPNDETFELNRVDGVSMEQLTHSRYITDIYGYCGTTSLQEFAGGNLAKFLPALKPVQKLSMAAWVAAGVADIHEVGKKIISGDSTAATNNTVTASLIHNDINMDNILLGNRDGIRVPLINDFNIAIFRKKDAETGAPCNFRGRFFNPQWMAPEQMFTKDREDELSIGFIDEKIDVYALGNILYKIAVGNSPWKYNFNKAKKILDEHKEKITRSKLKGGKPKVPDEVKNSEDPSIQAVLTAMDRCYRNDPDIRPSAREISDYLNKKFLTIGRKSNE
mmetsp:Transcript_29355/g.45403  ORF Transcript_29355/g.45403 Transcript_29355/m.45403 type:complete len:618 (+) Transcript_29355:56-1909(+)